MPNDGLCRLSKPTTPGAEVDYNDWDVYDYPSIGQIAELLRRNDVIPIFAVVETLQRLYKARIEFSVWGWVSIIITCIAI